MVRPRQLFLFSLLFFNSVFGDGENNGKSQITEDLKKGNSRTDAEQDPSTSVTLVGDAHSTLFATCLAASRTFEARFASIEVVPGSEYIRYVPDSQQLLSVPISWTCVTGNYPSILDCAQAAHDGGWSMFKYNGTKCQVVNTTYSLNDIPVCEEEDSDAVFILLIVTVEDCPQPRFFLGRDNTDAPICGLVNETLMTYVEAKAFCLGVFPNQELCLFVNEHDPLTVQTVISSFTSLGYTNTNLWVDAEERGSTSGAWYGNFAASDWNGGQIPAYAGANVPFRSAYMDKDASFKLSVSAKSVPAGALCVTFANSDSET